MFSHHLFRIACMLYMIGARDMVRSHLQTQAATSPGREYNFMEPEEAQGNIPTNSMTFVTY